MTWTQAMMGKQQQEPCKVVIYSKIMFHCILLSGVYMAVANKSRHSNNSNKNYYYSYNCCVTLLLGRYEELSTHPMLLCSNKILGDGESRYRVNDRHKCLHWNKQHTPFILEGRDLCTLHPPREGGKQLWSQVIAMAASDWSNQLLLSISCSFWGL